MVHFKMVNVMLREFYLKKKKSQKSLVELKE